jgi:hypothetical protein
MAKIYRLRWGKERENLHRASIDKALLSGESFRNIAGRFDISRSAVFRHKAEHIPGTLIKAKEAAEIDHGQDLFAHVQDLNRRTVAILEQAELANDPKTALSAIREARGNSELLCKMLVAAESSKTARDSQSDSNDTGRIEIILVRPDGSKSKVG